MPSPFPPIADYGFLSDCHTGALVAPDGAVAWLYVPRFDSPIGPCLSGGQENRERWRSGLTVAAEGKRSLGVQLSALP
jgi:GH15 family glucan-1,4-alpha-glucosidase